MSDRGGDWGRIAAEADRAVAVENEIVGNDGPRGAAVKVDGGFGGGGGADDGADTVAGDGPVQAIIAVDRGGLRGGCRGVVERAVFDATGIRPRLNGDGVAAGVAKGEVGDRDLVGRDVEDHTGGKAVGFEDRRCSGGRALEGETVGGEIRQIHREGVGASCEANCVGGGGSGVGRCDGVGEFGGVADGRDGRKELDPDDGRGPQGTGGEQCRYGEGAEERSD